MDSGASAPSRRVVGVLPDVTGVDRIFSYLVPAELDERCSIGSVVRVPLGSRRVRGWVIEEQHEVEELALREIHSFVSFAATEEIVELARFAAWRYAGRLRAFLVAASPQRNINQLPSTLEATADRQSVEDDAPVAAAIQRALAQPSAVLRLPPSTPRLEIVESALRSLRLFGRQGSVLVLLPEHADVARLGDLLSSRGEDVATYPDDWQLARTGARVVIGTRNAVLAPLSELSGIVVVDAHAEAYINERTPSWRAPVLARERARRADVPCLLVSPTTTLDLLGTDEAHTLRFDVERAGWPHLEILDRRNEDPRIGLFASGLAEIVRQARRAEPRRPVVAMLNRTGRARLLACRSCGELITCERCAAALVESLPDAQAEAAGSEVKMLACPKCHATRPVICSRCHSTSLRSLRIGVHRATEEFQALIGEPATELTASSDMAPVDAGLIVGTEAVLHRVRAASLVVMLDFDQELGAHRLRGAEHALGLLARAGRLVGGRGGSRSGFVRRVVVQTRTPDHVVLKAAVAGDPGILTSSERQMRQALHLPPYSALALLSGPEAQEVADALAGTAGVEVASAEERGILVRAQHDVLLLDALFELQVAARDLRVEVDPESV